MGAGKSKQKLKKKQRDELQEKTHMSDEDIMAWHRGKGYIKQKYYNILYIHCFSQAVYELSKSQSTFIFFHFALKITIFL